MAEYEGKPAWCAEKVLGIRRWSAMTGALDSVEKPPYRTLVRSGHRIGKTYGLAAFINFWFDVYDPGVVISTGASSDVMCYTVWSEVRIQRTASKEELKADGPAAGQRLLSSGRFSYSMAFVAGLG